MPVLLQRVRRFISNHHLMRSDTRVVCALSGGSDSVALAAVLDELDRSGELRFVGVAHLNHQLRPTADRDERFCREFAGRLGRPIRVERADVGARRDRDGGSLEAVAHDTRYELFSRARAEFAADVVAVGHTRDDRAETFLLRLLRGAGPRGLAGMWPRRGAVVRPLLDCSRDDLREFLRERRLPFVEDETNADTTIPRNRVRAELIPRLASDYNANIAEVLATEADLTAEIWAWLEAELDRFGSDLDVVRLQAAPVALQRGVLWRAMSEASGGRTVTAAHVAAAVRLVHAHDGASVDVPGVRVHRIGSRIVLTKRGSSGSTGDPMNHWRFPLSIPGDVTTEAMTVSAELVPHGAPELERSAKLGTGPIAAVRADLLCEGSVAHGLAVRNRRPGDRFRPVGLKGRKKLQDLFVDRKIARAARDFVPIVVDDRDRIVWVAGHGIDEAFRVTDPSQGMVVLKLRYLHPDAQDTRGGDPVERCS